MMLSELIKPECIKVSLESEDKEEVFEELMDLLVNVHHISDRNPLLNAIRERESKGSTGIGNGIAISHANSKTIERPYGVLGISENGMEYNSADNKPVHVVFLLITQENNPTEHLKILQRIAKITKDPRFLDSLIKSKNIKEAHKLIVDFEEQEV